MDTITRILDWLGYPGTIISIGIGIYAAYLLLRGIVPVLVRLGNGLSRRKIAVFASGDSLRSLEALLADCKLFRKSSVIAIPGREDFGKAEDASVFLMNWADFGQHIDVILRMKKDKTPLIVHALPGAIPPAMMGTLANERNVTVCNFRGRLLNDLVTSMITTSY